MPHIQLQSNQVVDVLQWGEVAWEAFEYSFMNNTNLEISATDTPNLDNTTSLNGMFEGCTNSDSDNLKDWDVSNVTSMFNLFRDCETFNQDISGWNVGSVLYMNNMFYGASAFNQDISSWDVSEAVSYTHLTLPTTSRV